MNESGCYFDEFLRHYPRPGEWSFWVNPEHYSVGAPTQGDLIRVIVPVFRTNAAQAYMRSIFHYVLTTVSGSPTFAEAASGLLGLLFTAILGNSDNPGYATAVNSNNTWKLPEVVGVSVPTDSYLGSNTQDGTVTGGTGTVPLRSATVVKKSTANRGRSYQGRTYMAPVDETQQTAGTLAATAITAAQNTANSFMAPSWSDGGKSVQFTQSVYSRKLSTPPATVVATPITSLSVRGTMGSQRRRQKVT